jgi:hypothetical protein
MKSLCGLRRTRLLPAHSGGSEKFAFAPLCETSVQSVGRLRVQTSADSMSAGVTHQARKMISATTRYTGSSTRVMIPVAANTVSPNAK